MDEELIEEIKCHAVKYGAKYITAFLGERPIEIKFPVKFDILDQTQHEKMLRILKENRLIHICHGNLTLELWFLNW